MSLCSANAQALGALAGSTPHELPACRDHMTFSTGSPSAAAEVFGWSHTEEWGTWSVAPQALVECRLSDQAPSAIDIVAQGFGPDTGSESVVSSVAGGGMADVAVTHMRRTEWRVPLGRAPSLILMFTTPDMVSPVSRGVNEDARKLGVGLMSIDLIRGEP